MANRLEHIKVDLSRGLGLSAVKDWMQQNLLLQKLNNPAGFGLLAGLAILLAYLIGTQGTAFALVALAGVIGVPMMLGSLFNLRFGIFFVLTVSFFLLGAKRYLEVYGYDIPLGLIMDVFVSVLFFGLLIKQIRTRDWSFARGPISVMILIWIGYNLLEVANPTATSRLAWIYTIRSMAGVMVVYFIALYAIDSLKMASKVLKLTMILCLLGALYAIFQEWFGLTQIEQYWVRSDEELFNLLFQGGKIRKFSFFSNPVVLGIVMAYGSMMCFIFVMGPFSVSRKIGLVLAGFAMLIAAIYSGTRTAYVILPAAFFFYTLLSMKREVILLAALFFGLGITLLTVPTVNADHHRIKTAFSVFTGDRGARDPSFEIRLENQKRIQPFIQTHPMGGGLGSVGAWGKRFSPGTFLAEFPPDSGFIRIAVEQGWIGLLLYCALLFVIFRVGIKNYFKVKDPKIKSFYEVCLTFLFALVVANYPQEAITQLPTNFLFYIIIALLVRLKDFDSTPNLTPGVKDA